VLDLPQLYTKPSGEALLLTLDNLKSGPPSWQPKGDGSDAEHPALPNGKIKVRSQGLPSYLTKIISSSLDWIEDNTIRELVWESAAKCLSERSGRTALGSITRSFSIPTNVPEAHGAAVAATFNPASAEASCALNIVLHEPALTADNVGFKTWASSHLLARRLVILKDMLPQLPTDSVVLELGAGTGLVGLAAAAILRRRVLLTDLPEIIPNLERNIESNKGMLDASGINARAAVLDWTEPNSLSTEEIDVSSGFLLILAADTVYTSEQPALLTQTIKHHLSHDVRARAVITIPQREGFDAEVQDFRARMLAAGLLIIAEGEESGYDDWGIAQSDGNEDGLAQVTCVWSIWAWQ
jgi:predicted nicotinamide N-methyase